MYHYILQIDIHGGVNKNKYIELLFPRQHHLFTYWG